MKILLVAINAQYIHTNLALRSLKAYAEQELPELFNTGRNVELSLCEFTINHRFEFLLEELFRLQPDVLCFSCYLWNMELVRDLAREYKKIMPQVKIVLGGPEVSYTAAETLCGLPEADYLLAGEGEEPFCRLIRALEQTEDLGEVPSLYYREGDKICSTSQAAPLGLEKLPFCYSEEELKSGKILYYESMRGCPYSCQYCLSSAEQGVRFRPLEQVFQDLSRFLAARVPQVKFVDRTFNCSKAHGLSILQFLVRHDNGVTNFHFEIGAHLLDEQWFECLRPARPGLFQLEIGVQSTHVPTIAAIRRSTDFTRLSQAVRQIQSFGNIHLHLDLIAGLPYEDYDTFSRSFNDVYALHPAQLQLGFLKLLKGSGLRRDAEKYGIRYLQKAPYEVLYTRELKFAQLVRLKEICRMVETYYNSGRFRHSLSYLEGKFVAAFSLYEWLAEAFRDGGMHLAPRRSDEYYSFLAAAWERKGCAGQPDNILRALLLHDLCLHEKPRRIPQELESPLTAAKKKEQVAFYRREVQERRFFPEYASADSQRLSRLTHLEIFPVDVLHGCEDRPVAVAYHYQRRDLFGNAAAVEVTL